MHLTPAVKDRIEISIGKALSRIVRFLLIRFPCSVGQLAQPEHFARMFVADYRRSASSSSVSIHGASATWPTGISVGLKPLWSS